MRTRTTLSSWLAALSLLIAPQASSTAGAQLPGIPQSESSPAAASGVAQASPRASLEAFMRFAEAGDLVSAASYLQLQGANRERGAELARKLKQVIDQRVALDLRLVSPLAAGDTTDGDPNADVIGSIVGPEGESSVRMVRATTRIPQRWIFSAQTVARVDEWHSTIGATWLRNRLPSALEREGPLNIYLWQWIGLVIAVPLLLLVSWLVSMTMRSIMSRLTRRTAGDLDDRLVMGLRGPFRLWVAALGIRPIAELLELNASVSAFLGAASRGLVLIALFWGLLRFIKLGQKRMEDAAFEHGQVQARTLIPLLGNILRVTLAIVALLVALSQFGYPVGTLLTGLGIGGIALALAAQKTVENLFGSVSLAADKAFRIGDWVRAGGTEGSIERIGLRSTSFRTNDRTVVRVPNGKLAEERIETFGERDRMLFKTDLDLTYETTAAQLQAVRDEVEATLRAHPKIWPDAVHVYFVGFLESAMRVNVTSWLQTTNYPEFLKIRHELLLEFMRIVERHGSSFAYPTRTVRVTADSAQLVPPPAHGAVVNEQREAD